MRKAQKIVSLLLVIAFIPIFTASCKDRNYGDYDSTGENYDCYLPDYIDVCNYKGLEVPDISTEPTDEDVENRLKQQITLYAPRTEDPDRGAVAGDVVDIVTTCRFTDTGKIYSLLNFKRGSNGLGQSFCLGTNYFFTKELDDAVIGMKQGEEKTVKFNLPDPYYKDIENSGREVEMEISLTYIDEVDYSVAESDPNSVTENTFFIENFGYTEDQYRTMLKNKYREELQELTADYKVILTWNYICDNSEMKQVPEKEYNDYYNGKLDSDRAAAEEAEQTLAEYIKDQYDYENMDDYYAYLKDYSESRCFEEMILYYIIRCEKLTLPDDYYEEQLTEMGKEYQLEEFSDIEDFFDYYYGIENVRETLLFKYTQEWIADNAKVREDVNTMYGLKK